MRHSLPLVLALAACGPEGLDPELDPQLLPVDQAGPGSIVLDMDYLVRGERVNISISGLVPNRPAVILFTPDGPQTPGFCPPPAQPTCTDLAGSPGVVGTPRANGAGVVNISAVVPPALPYPEVTFQVVQTNPFNSSNTVTLQNLTSGGDQDGDGLSNSEEVGTYGTDPFEADSDGGGVDDGDEVTNGTDPNDPNDDTSVAGIDALVPGDLVITEMLPISVGFDVAKEWIEIYNDAGFDVDLAGLEVRIAGTTSVLGSYVLAADDYVVIGRTTDTGLNGGTPVDIAIGGAISLPDTGGTLVLTANGTNIDLITYTPSWPIAVGRSLEFGDQWLDRTNAEKAYWCQGADAFGTAGNLATPGAPNGDCPITTSWTSFFQPTFLVGSGAYPCTGCHTGGGAQGGVNFDTYAEAFQPSNDVPSIELIRPFEPGASYLYLKVSGTQTSVPGGTGLQMPRGGPVVDATTRDRLRDWILLGAPQFDVP